MKRIKVSFHPSGDMMWAVQVLTDRTPHNIDLVAPNKETYCEVQPSPYNLMRVEVHSAFGGQGFKVKVDDEAIVDDKTNEDGDFSKLIGFEVE